VKADAIKVKTKSGASKESDASMSAKVKSEIIAWFWIGLVFLLVNGTLGQARVIPSGSMENTLLVGDHLIMSRIGYDAGIPFTNIHVPLWRDPKRQQIIIFKPPYGKPDQPDLIKRVIGLPATRLLFTMVPCGSTERSCKKTTRPALQSFLRTMNCSPRSREYR